MARGAEGGGASRRLDQADMSDTLIGAGGPASGGGGGSTKPSSDEFIWGFPVVVAGGGGAGNWIPTSDHMLDNFAAVAFETEEERLTRELRTAVAKVRGEEPPKRNISTQIFPSKYVTVSGLDRGGRAAVLDADDSEVAFATEVRGVAKIDVSRHGGAKGFVPADGWPTVAIYDADGTRTLRRLLQGVLPGETIRL